jgi:hypothetical protein
VPKFWQSTEKNAKLNRVIAVLGSKEVKEVRPNGLTADECYGLLVSNNVCSLPMAKQYLKELLFGGRVKIIDGLYQVGKPASVESREEVGYANQLLSMVANAKSGTIDRSTPIQRGETTDEGVLEE